MTMTTVPTMLSADQIVNYGIGTDLLNEFMNAEKIAIKKDGDHYYTNKTVSPDITKSNWNLQCDELKYLNGATVYKNRQFWGQTVEMIRGNGKTKTHTLGKLQYNIPNANVLQQQQNSSHLRMIQDRYYQQQQIKRMEQKRAQDKEKEKGREIDGVFK